VEIHDQFYSLSGWRWCPAYARDTVGRRGVTLGADVVQEREPPAFDQAADLQDGVSLVGDLPEGV
jgi:hypothetical protein